jgi:hypothetical protein
LATIEDGGVPSADQDEGINEDAVREIIDRILRVPTKYREFSTSLDQARMLYSIQGNLLDMLLDLGLPNSGSSADRKFSGLDLENIGNALGLHYPGWRQLCMLAITFGQLRSPTPIGYQVRAVSKCPEPAHDGSCDVAPSRAVVDSGARVLECDSTGVTAEIHLPRIRQSLNSAIDPLVEIAAGLEFHFVPAELRTDVGFAMETGLADCGLGTAVLLANGALTNHPLRRASGLIMSVPFMMKHSWLEIGVAGGWISIDPFFLISLARWRIIDSEAWPPGSPTGHVYWTLPEKSLGDVSLTTDHAVRSQVNARILNWRDIFSID